MTAAFDEVGEVGDGVGWLCRSMQMLLLSLKEEIPFENCASMGCRQSGNFVLFALGEEREEGAEDFLPV